MHADCVNDHINLLQRVSAGSEAAMNDFYHVFHAMVYAFALRRLSNPAEAADVLNEVMLEVWRHAQRFEGRSKVSTWVLGITHHKTIDKMRKRKDKFHEEFDPETVDEDSPNAVEIMSGAEDASAVRECMEQLSDAHKQVVHLAFFEELSYAEIAEIADCPEGTVKTRMFHAKQSLKRCLAGLMQAGAH